MKLRLMTIFMSKVTLCMINVTLQKKLAIKLLAEMDLNVTMFQLKNRDVLEGSEYTNF